MVFPQPAGPRTTNLLTPAASRDRRTWVRSAGNIEQIVSLETPAFLIAIFRGEKSGTTVERRRFSSHLAASRFRTAHRSGAIDADDTLFPDSRRVRAAPI